MGVCCSNTYSEFDEEIYSSKTIEDLIVILRRRRREYIADGSKIKEYMTNSNKFKKNFEVKFF